MPEPVRFKHMTGSTRPFQQPTGAPPAGGAGDADSVLFRAPRPSDGARMWRLASESGELDANSPYAYLLWCRDFAESSVVGCQDGAVIAYITGYLRPAEPATLFVWQVAVDAAHRRRGLARRSLEALVGRVSRHHPVDHLEATVTPGNMPSARLFESFARARDAPLATQSLFSAQDFAGADHEEEVLYRIGPF